MRELHIPISDLDKMPPLRKLRYGLYLEQIELRTQKNIKESRNKSGVRDKNTIKIEHPGIEEFINKKNLEVYGTEDGDRFSYIPKYKPKKGMKKK